LVRNKTQLSIYIVGAMLLADFVLFGYWPSKQRLEILYQTQAKQRSLISLAEAHRWQLPTLKRSLAQCDQTLTSYQNRVPVQRELGSFLQDISVLMSQNRLEDHVIMPGVEMEVAGLIAVPVAVRCKGHLNDLFDFYRKFASIERLVQLKKVQFTNEPDLGGRVQMEAQMMIFYRPGFSSENESALERGES
jgi:Tfp pilus assembly protein PilO